ncbi:MAG: hypothetical protein ABWY00_18585 [Dongiaceae bacterium]
MMDDLDELQTRVAAAQEKMRLSADDQRKYGLRLNDVVAIVEGSLARQQDEMRRLQEAAAELSLERDTARQAEAEIKSAYDSVLPKLAKREAQNEQLRAMVLTLLNVIEGRESALALQSVMQRLEDSLTQLTTAGNAAAEVDKEPDAPFSALIRNTHPISSQEPVAVAELAPVAISVEASADAEIEAAERLAKETATAALDAVPEAAEAIDLAAEHLSPVTETGLAADDVAEIEAAEDDDLPEDVEQISMTEHESLVADPEMDVAAAEAHNGNGFDKNGHQEEPLMSALLDAEKALIEAGANGFANGTSPVADIIRRISLRTREFSEASAS